MEDHMIKLKELLFGNKALSGYFLREGLIKTYSIGSTIEHLNNFVRKNRNIFARVKLNKPNVVEIIINNNIEKTDYNDVLSIMNSYGWYPSLYVFIKSKEDFDNRNYDILKYSKKELDNIIQQKEFYQIFIQFEAKYDLEITDRLPKELYHITDESYLEKIKKIGLTPKTKSKLTNHPDRIYMGVDKNKIKNLLKLKGFSDFKNPILITIDTKLTNGLRIFEDPNYAGIGIYSYQNIPPKALVNFEEV